jgi:hypothetical protein
MVIDLNVPSPWQNFDIKVQMKFVLPVATLPITTALNGNFILTSGGDIVGVLCSIGG